MSWFDEVKKDLSIAGAGMHGLEIIGTLIKQVDPNSATLADVLGVIGIAERVIDTIANGAAGNVSTEEVNDSLTAFQGYLTSRKADDQVELDKKFPK